jgi:hypothetical protein
MEQCGICELDTRVKTGIRKAEVELAVDNR